MTPSHKHSPYRFAAVFLSAACLLTTSHMAFASESMVAYIPKQLTLTAPSLEQNGARQAFNQDSFRHDGLSANLQIVTFDSKLNMLAGSKNEQGFELGAALLHSQPLTTVQGHE